MGWSQLLRMFLKPENKSELISHYLVLTAGALYSIFLVIIITYWLIRRQAIPCYSYMIEEVSSPTLGESFVKVQA